MNLYTFEPTVVPMGVYIRTPGGKKNNKIMDLYTAEKEREIFLENCLQAEKRFEEKWRLQKKRRLEKKGFFKWKVSNPFSFDDLFDDDLFEWISNLI